MDQQEAATDEKEQLNAVLDAALDELDDNDDDDEEQHDAAAAAAGSPPQQEKHTQKPSKPKPVYGPEKPPDFDIGSFDDVMSKMFQVDNGGSDDPEAALDSFMQQLQTQLAAEMEKMESPNKQESTSTKSGKSAAKQTNGAEPPSDGNDVDRTISKLLNDMATANVDDDGEGAGDGMPGGGEEAMFQDMMRDFEKMGGGGGGFDQDAVVDGMMQQLLSKEIMYEPMKQVTERFPAWLEENKESLSEEEYKNRSQQYECFKKLIYVYENESDNVKKLMELMQDVQEYGQPPPEIIKEIAPGLDLDEEGVPKLDGIGGLPFGGNEECRLM